MTPAMEREYFSIGGGHGASDALKLPVGALIGVGCYDEGMRFACGKVVKAYEQVTQVNKETKEETIVSVATLVLRVFPYAGKPAKLRLVHTETRRGVYGWEHVLCLDGSGQEYILTALTEAELKTAKRLMQTGDEQTVSELTPKEVAHKLMGVIAPEPQGAKKLARLAGVEYTELVVSVLGKLREAGMVKRVKVIVDDVEVKRWKLA